MKKMLSILFFTALLMMPLVSFAYTSPTYSTGMILDDSLHVIGVNVNGAAYNSGIRPGDQIISVYKDNEKVAPENIINTFNARNHVTYQVRYQHPDEINSTRINLETKKGVPASEVGTFLILNNADENFKKLISVLNFAPRISEICQIQSVNKEMKLINTSSQVASTKGLGEVFVGQPGLGLIALKTDGNFAVADAPESMGKNCSLIKIGLTYNIYFQFLFGQTWSPVTSSGMLEKSIIEELNKTPL